MDKDHNIDPTSARIIAANRERVALELRHNRDQGAIEAGRSVDQLNRFVYENRRFILRCASRTCNRFITESDDEYEVALVAFCEAVRTFDPEVGGFNGFAALVIRRRLMDYFDSVKRRGSEVLMGNAMTWDDDEGPQGVVTELQRALLRESEAPERTVRDEIDAMAAILRNYGFSFFDVADASPKSSKTRGFCARAVNWMLDLAERILRMRQRRNLPVAEMTEACDLSRKVVDRHRRYIIAATEILDGDFPQLAEYLQYIKRGRES